MEKYRPALMALADRIRDFVDIKRSLGDENHVGAACDAAVKRDPAGIAAHHFHHHHSIVSFCRGVDPVKGFADDVAGGIKAKGVVGAAQIVVDGFGDANDVNAAFMELLSNRKRVVSTDCDKSLDVIFLEGRYAPVDAVGTL